MKIHSSNIEKLVVFSFLFIGILLVIKMNVIYNKKHNEKLEKEKINQLIEEKKEKENRLPLDPERKIKIVNIQISDNEITPDTVSASLGEEVQINAHVIEGYHNLNIQFYNLESKSIATGKTGFINFIATKSGEFRIFSDTGKYAKPEPEGVLIIK